MPASGGQHDRGVRIEPDSIIGRYAEYHTRAKQRRIGAIGAKRRDMNLFVENEILIDGNDRELAEELSARYGAELIEQAAIPPLPVGMKTRRVQIDPSSIPKTTKVRFKTPPQVEGMGDLLDRSIGSRRAVASSEMAAAVAAVVEQHRDERGTIGLNFVGEPLAMPLAKAKEGVLVDDPFTWLFVNGRIRIVDAWQLIDSIRQVRGDSMVWLAILDEGFWLDGNGVPNVAMGESASDFGSGVMQMNLINESEGVGGPTGFAYKWHGNGVASIAAGALNNSAGTAGVAGNTAHPVFFRTNIDIDQMMYCAKICAAWGLDVLNISNGTWGQSELWFPTSQWNKTFQFAADNGVVIIAAAGNASLDLPDDENIRPATRTPGVLTVGALTLEEKARDSSNYGSSVGLWAPGSEIPVAPDGDFAGGSKRDGTSYAAPIVAGVAAMMRYANPQLSAHEIRSILINTGWQGEGRVTKGLDAYAAVLAAIQQTLPDNSEPNNTPQTAQDLIPVGPGGALVPTLSGFTAKASATDPDYWKFRLTEVSTVTVTVEWYERLSSLSVIVETDDPNVVGIEDLKRTGDAHSGVQTLTGVLPPAWYRIRVSGSGATAYRLLVNIKAAELPKDRFEPNDSFETAARMIFEPHLIWTFDRREWGPGTFDATLHRNLPVLNGPGRINDDYFLLDVPDASTVFHIPEVSIFDADIPLNITLYDAARNVIQQWTGVRQVTAYPPGNSTCYLKVTAAGVSRYWISTKITYDADAVPGPQQKPFEIIPDWWFAADPVWIREPEHHVIVEVHTRPGDGGALVFEHSGDPVTIELLDRAGDVIARGEGAEGRVSIETDDIEAGAYVMRIKQERGTSGSPVRLSRVPPLR